MTIVAVTIDENGHERLVGLGTYVVNPVRNEAETAFMVADDYQGRGIGAALFRRLADVARTKGLRALVADVLPQNAAMFRVLQKSGLAVQIDQGTGRVAVLLG
jgi:GNAT superfamily N-acetyltransferase